MTTYIGIDPGPERSAIVSFDGTQVLDTKYTDVDGIFAFLAWKYVEGAEACIEFPQARGGITPGRSVFDTCFVAGRIAQWCHQHRIPVWGVYPSTHYRNLTQVTNPKSGEVSACLKDRIGEPGTIDEPGPTRAVFNVSSGEHKRDALSVAYAMTSPDRKKWIVAGTHWRCE